MKKINKKYVLHILLTIIILGVIYTIYGMMSSCYCGNINGCPSGEKMMITPFACNCDCNPENEVNFQLLQYHSILFVVLLIISMIISTMIKLVIQRIKNENKLIK